MKRIELSFELKKPILACGADMKGAFALARGREAFLFEGFGDLADPDNLERYEKAVKNAEKRLGIKPKIAACDLHPLYFSARFAEGSGLKLYRVQHHEAHIAGALLDNSIKGNVIGVAFDGTGFGPDENIWGGEFFVGNARGFKRAGHLKYIPMPGSEAAVKEPWRMAVSYLYDAFGGKFGCLKIELMKKAGKKNMAILKQMIDKNINSPLTSSMGRLFDGAGSLILAKKDAAFEAELPIELESMASGDCRDMYDYDIDIEKGIFIIRPGRIFKGIVKDLLKNTAKAHMSAKFHNTVADMVLKVSHKLRIRFKTDKIVLSGGVFQNRFLLRRAREILIKNSFDIVNTAGIPVNDYGISIGQIAIAGARPSCV